MGGNVKVLAVRDFPEDLKIIAARTGKKLRDAMIDGLTKYVAKNKGI